jgi:putative CocE/NonD family hydrolase
MQFRGLTVGSAALLDLPVLHREWYDWTMADGPRPSFLSAPVRWYLMGADQWRDAPSLEAITTEYHKYYLAADRNPTSVFASGRLQGTPGQGSGSYVYDPTDTSSAMVQAQMDPQDVTDQRLVLARDGRQLVYHTRPFSDDIDIAGFFRLRAWIAIDQPDTDFQASVYEVRPDGVCVLLTSDRLRARYRTDPARPILIDTTEALPYDFNGFTFVATRVSAGSRLRLVFDSIDSIYRQKNYNSGKDVSDETMADARAVTVTLVHDDQRPSALEVPIAAPE